jgi:hypothetical protein
MTWPNDRPVAYDETKYFDIHTETWVSNAVLTAGGRYHRTLIVVGQDAVGQGVLYVGEA